jgi:hypothetical protein
MNRSRRILLAALVLCLCGSPAGAEPLSTIDLLVLYTPGAAARYAGDPETRIEHVVGVANQIYEDSGVWLRLRLVHAEEVDYSDTVTSSAALQDLSAAGHPLHEQATALREAYGADVVTLMRPYSADGYCGIAWMGGLGTNGQLSITDSTYAFSHVSIDCSNYVLAHELGHNMGLAHSRRQSPVGGTFEHSLGYGVDMLFTTVMAYETAFGAPKIYKHSSPALACLGVPCGVEASSPDDGADAVSSLNAVRTQLEAYRETVMPIGPLDPVDPGDLVPPMDPGTVFGAEVRILSPKSHRRRIRAGKVYELEWEASGVATVDIQYRESWREGSSDFIALEWTVVAEDLVDGRFDWTVPELPGRKVSLQLRLIGRNAAGYVIASHATRHLRVKRRRR